MTTRHHSICSVEADRRLASDQFARDRLSTKHLVHVDLWLNKNSGSRDPDPSIVAVAQARANWFEIWTVGPDLLMTIPAGFR